ncbi:hypothetical protein B0H14DRAFT_3444934 [Mycena olivaceomarginata]|nr:hypothetical protein B0H14DRAFT_3444934 [Mycena olivaceomarginata]
MSSPRVAPLEHAHTPLPTPAYSHTSAADFPPTCTPLAQPPPTSHTRARRSANVSPLLTTPHAPLLASTPPPRCFFPVSELQTPATRLRPSACFARQNVTAAPPPLLVSAPPACVLARDGRRCRHHRPWHDPASALPPRSATAPLPHVHTHPASPISHPRRVRAVCPSRVRVSTPRVRALRAAPPVPPRIHLAAVRSLRTHLRVGTPAPDKHRGRASVQRRAESGSKHGWTAGERIGRGQD